MRRAPRGRVLTEKDSSAAPASTRVRGCTQSHGQSCGACLERFFEPLTGAAAPAWELLRRQTCPKWTCCTNTAACVQACERGAQKSAEAGSPHAIRAGSQPRAPAGPQHERFANCERRGAVAHAPVGDTRFGVQGARARRVANRAWPRTSVWYLLAPRSPHTRPHCSPPPPGPRASRDAPCISGAAARVLEEFLRSPRANINAIGCIIIGSGNYLIIGTSAILINSKAEPCHVNELPIPLVCQKRVKRALRAHQALKGPFQSLHTDTLG